MKKIFLIYCVIFVLFFVGCNSSTNQVETIEISTVEDLLLLENEVSANYILTNDIDCGGKKFNSIDGFCGKIDGQGYVIRNVEFIDEKNHFGLIGTSSSFFDGKDRDSVVIKNLGIEDFVINADYECGDLSLAVGAFIASSDYSVKFENCYSTGEINISQKGDDTNVGGLVGYVYSVARVTNCYSDVDIKCINPNGGGGYTCFGGLIGRCFKAFIETCYCSGDIIYKNDSSWITDLYGADIFMGAACGLPETMSKLVNFINLSGEMSCNVKSEYLDPLYGGTYAKGEILDNYYCAYTSDSDYESTKYSFTLSDSLSAVSLAKNIMASKDFLTGKCSSLNEFGEEIGIPCNFSEEIWNMYAYEEGNIKYPTLKVFD